MKGCYSNSQFSDNVQVLQFNILKTNDTTLNMLIPYHSSIINESTTFQLVIIL